MRKLLSILLSMTILCSYSIPAYAAKALWEASLPQAAKWSQVTQEGTLLVGTNTTLSGIDTANGNILWTRDDLKKTAPFNTKEVPGTSILLINDYSGMGTNTRLYAINLTDGKDIWATQPEAGYAIGIFPIPSKNMAILFYSGWSQEDGTGVYARAYELTTGNKLWEEQFARGNNPVVLHSVDDAKMFYSKADLSGHQDPVVEGDNMYIPFRGLDCLDLNTGKIKWSVPFKTGIQLYKKAYAPIVLEKDIIYASGYGTIYAIDKNTGTIKWQSQKITSGQIAEVTPVDEMLLARVGGFFYEPGSKTFKLDTPLQVVAYNKSTGAELWKLRQIELGITNLLYLPSSKTVVLADGKGLIGLDAQSTGKATEKFRVPLKFTRSIGGSEWAAAGVKTVTGGIGGLLNAGVSMAASKKKRMDIPVNVALNEEGMIVVRGKQHIMSFDPNSQEIQWSNHFPASGAGMFEIGVMVALTAFSTLTYQAGYASGSYSAQSASDGIKRAFANLDKTASKRYQASKMAPTHSYILTRVEDEGKKGLGILAVNIKTGEPDRQFLFNDKDPLYSVDEIDGKIYYFNKKTKLEAYALK